MVEYKGVIGANFGDEGKGLATAEFCRKALADNRKCLVVCHNGGAQRGHTVVTRDGQRHVFHHLGSGTLVGADTYLSSEYIVNPMIFHEEYAELLALGYAPRVFMDENCRVSTPYDMMLNQIAEETRGDARHGSCGVGIWQTALRYARKQMAYDWKTLSGLSYYELRAALEALRAVYVLPTAQTLSQNHLRAEWQSILMKEKLIDRYIEDIQRMKLHTISATPDVMQAYDCVVLETGQGLRLDQNATEYASAKERDTYTTPSNTGIRNMVSLIEADSREKTVEICYVSRTYLTRHGAGPFQEECSLKEINPRIRDKTNAPNPWQGTIRYGRLREREMVERCLVDFSSAGHPEWNRSLVLTHLNELQPTHDAAWFSAYFDRVYFSAKETGAFAENLKRRTMNCR